MKVKFGDIIDIARIQRLTDLFYKATGIPATITDLEGNILTGSGWQRICTEFHRVNPEMIKRCVESDTIIANRIETGQKYTLYECKNGLIDAATPITVQGEHIVNFFTGQFLFEPPDVEVYRDRARRFGLDESAYLAALAEVPIIRKEKIPPFLEYFAEFAELLADMGLKQLQQIEAREKLIESQALLKAIVEGSPDAIYAKDRLGRYLLFNPAAEGCTGLRSLDVIGKDDTYLFPVEEARRVMEKDREIMVGIKAETYEEDVSSTKGTVTFLATKGPLVDDLGKAFGMFGISRNITERKRAERELKQAYETLEERIKERTLQLSKSREVTRSQLAEIEAYYNMAPLGLCTLDRNLKYLRINKKLAKLHGLSPADHVGKTIREVIPHLADQLEEQAYRVLQSGEAVKDIEIYQDVGPIGKRVWKEMMFPLKDSAFQITGVGVVVEEITGQRKLEEQLRQSQKMEAIGTLAGGIAHDFNNMLAIIMGNAELALEDTEDQAVAEHLKQILNASKRSRDLVKKILSFSRKKSQQEKALKVVPLFKETCDLLKASLPATVDLQVNIRTKADTTLLADASGIQQVIINLANNAAYAMRERGGVLRIGLSSVIIRELQGNSKVAGGRYVKLTVKDTGSGMSAETQQRMYEPFFSTKELGQGTGMGLSVVWGIVQAHHGVIEVESQEGLGSKFIVLLPQMQTSLTSIEEKKEEEEERVLCLDKKRVIFVDDEPSIVAMTTSMLERMDCDVVACSAGSEALALFSKDPHAFDLIITDQTMLGMTGLALAKAVLSIRKDMPIILCTGYSEMVSPETAEEAGIRAFVMKPVTRKELGKAISRVMEQETT